MSECLNCHGKCGFAEGFCDACSIDMIADIYDCPRCKRLYSKCSYDFACKNCSTEEEKQWLIDHWPELKHKP